MVDSEQGQVPYPIQATKNSGIVYVLSNPAMENYIKIGKTSGDSAKDVQDRMRQLDTTGVPRAFNCEYAAVVENYEAVETALLTGFGENRVRANREFLEGIPPFRIKAFLKLLEIQDVTPDSSSTDIDSESFEPEKPVKTPSFKFSMAQISPGEFLQWADNPDIECQVVADNLRVEYDGEEHALSRLTAKLKGWKVNYAQVGPYWLHQNKTLDEWRDEYLEQVSADT